VNTALANEGAALYARRCGSCHGDAAVSGGLVPDLRYSPALSNDALWKSVVEEGALSANGMVAFKTELSRRQEDALRAFLIRRAQESYDARAK
jgi:alcohol dehydrogenase (cytochrome c)/quinohemoprotein ethanol dehydrogenase